MADHEEQRRKSDNPGFSRLLELLHGSYLKKGVRNSVASKLEQAESRLESAKKMYLEHSLLHSELGSVLDPHPHPSTQPPSRGRASGSEEKVGREVLAAGEAQHCLQLHPEATLLGVTADHLRHAGGRALSGASKEAVLRELEERLRAKCLRVVHWYSDGRTTGSESLQLAKAAQLPGLLSRQIHQLDTLEVGLRGKKEGNAQKLLQQYKVLVETCSVLHGALEQARLGSLAHIEQVRLANLQARCTALVGKQEVMYYQLLKGICSEGRLQALQEIRSQLAAQLQATEEQLTQTRHTLQHYISLGPELASLAQQYAATLAEIENKKWALNELGKSCPTSAQ